MAFYEKALKGEKGLSLLQSLNYYARAVCSLCNSLLLLHTQSFQLVHEIVDSVIGTHQMFSEQSII